MAFRLLLFRHGQYSRIPFAPHILLRYMTQYQDENINGLKITDVSC